MENKSLERSSLVLVTCGFIGVGFTLPMSFYISADAYWKDKWRIVEDSTQPFNLGIKEIKMLDLHYFCQTSSGDLTWLWSLWALIS